MTSKGNSGEVFTGGATTSQHVDAEDEDHFENTTFKLKRTRSLGLLDEFIQPGDTANSEMKEQTSSESCETDEGTEDGGGTRKLSVDTSGGDGSEDESALASPGLLKSPDMLPHDDTDLMHEPSQHVDYLSHKWDVSDISKSWRYIIQKRKDVANSARLENASWRTWAQRRSNLKTISPEVVNWSKDSDVTWLYGPIMKDDEHGEDDEVDNYKRITTATSAAAGDISIPNATKKGPKPILKRRTMQDIMISHSNLLKLQLATNRLHNQQKQRQQQLQQQQQQERANKSKNSSVPPEFDDYDAISAKLNSQYRSLSSQNSTASLTSVLNEKKHSTPSDKSENASNLDHSDQVKPSLSSNEEESSEDLSSNSKEKRRIHFNDEVQQCIAVDTFSDDDYDDEEEDEDDYYDDDYDDDGYIYENPRDYEESESSSDEDADEDEGGFFLKVKSPTSSISAVPGISLSGNKENVNNNDNTEDTDSISTNNSKMYRTIHLLPSTTLNYGSSDEESDEENPYTSSLSHNVNNNSSRGYDYYYDYNTVYTVDPNHSIYGRVANPSDTKLPDVVDVPENISVGSNFDYEVIDKKDFTPNENPMPIIDPVVINNNNSVYNKGDQQLSSGSSNPTNEASSANRSQSSKHSPFNLSDSEEDSEEDSDDGLSISTRNSSQSLAQSVYGQALTPGNDVHFPEPLNQPQPVSASISSINPTHDTTKVSRQPSSSSSLSDQFFGASMTKSHDSSSSLADQFFNRTQSPSLEIPGEECGTPDSMGRSGRLSATQKKSSPLPPHTTSENAFSGSSSPTGEKQVQPTSNTFDFDSESDSDEPFIEDVAQLHSDQPSSYASLSRVAGKNGIKSPSNEDSLSSENSNNSPNIVGQAKGLATHFLGNWKNNE